MHTQQQHDQRRADQRPDMQQQEDMLTPEPTSRSINGLSQPSNMSAISTDDEEYHDDRILDDGIPSDIPLEALAGPALILPSTQDLDDGHTLTEEFDWAGQEDDEDENEQKDHDDKKKGGALMKSSVIICLSQNHSSIAYTCIALFTLILIAIDVAVFVVYQRRDQVSITSYGLQVWFTWIAFMWCIGFMSQIFVELVPWTIKKAVGILRPHSTEVLRMRLSYYMALRHYIKLFILSAWAWGSWAFISVHCQLPIVSSTPENGDIYASRPNYVSVFFSIWECLFFATLFLFIEKFILQLIVTSFHKKAYGDRIKENDKGLRVLDRLKKMKRKNPQEFLLKRIRRKNKTYSTPNSGTAAPSRSHSLDEAEAPYFQGLQSGTKSSNFTPPINKKGIMSNQQQNDPKSNVKFPPTQNMDTLIAIPALEDRRYDDDEKQDFQQQEDVAAARGLNNRESSSEDMINKISANDEFTQRRQKKRGLMSKWTNKMKRDSSSNQQQQSTTAVNTPEDYHNSKSRSTSQPLSRETICFNRNSQDEKGFFGHTRDFGRNTKAIPGKFIKDNYNKFLSQNRSNPNIAASQMQGRNSTQQAKFLAKKIFHNIMGPDSTVETITESDMYPFFSTTKEVQYAFGLFDTDGNGDITRRELRSGCIRIYRERKNLTRSMRDLSQATGKLDIILMIIFVVVWAIIVCAAFGVNVGTDLMPLWSAFVAASFIFGTSAKDAFEAIIFVFVTHPFDAGDRVYIQGENWMVHNVGLLVTTFIKWDGTVVYAKNSVLTTQYIFNVRRSGRTGESLELQISFETPSWKIRKITEHMTEWCNQFPKLYTPNSASTSIVNFTNQNMISLSFYFEHTQNWQDAGGRWLRHNNYMFELKEACERLEITYSLPPQPYTETGNPKNDAPPESYNMGRKAGYGLEGMNKRRPFVADDFYEDGSRNQPVGNESGDLSSGNPSTDNSGAVAGAAASMMFAATT